MQRGKVIAYASRQLKTHEKNYTTHDLELGEVVFAFKAWRNYLYRLKSVIYTDHKSLQHIFDQKELNMRQQRWVELFSDFDSEIRYHSRKANVVADALSRKERVKPRQVRAMSMTISQVLRTRYWLLQVRRPRLPRSSSWYDTNWVIVDRLTKSSHFLAIREDYKMEKLARLYIDEIVVGHRVPVSIISDRDGRFTSRVLANITESLRDAIGYEYGLSSLNRWTKRKLLEFEVGDQVLLKVSPWKGVICFVKKGKLEPRYVGPFEILRRVSLVAYRLRLPEELSSVHDTFHVSNLTKCLADANLHVPLDEIKVDKTLRFIEEPIEIMDREVKSLKRSKISIVKVCWNSKRGPEFTWEREDHMKAKYPRLFVDCVFYY
ncbi:putative reverse transcriptase domain-containing protein [Tanacetum coccineum]